MGFQVKSTDKILVIAPHPDDEVIACGGFIAKYHKQIDILCVNSSGIQYKGETKTAEEIAQIRCDEFKNVAKLAGVNKTYIEKLWGRSVMIDEIEKHLNDYMRHFNMQDYDVILVPHQFDNHPEHQYVGNVLLKKMLEKQGYKNTLKILRYELWSPLHEVNHYEDITDFVDKKRELITAYKIRDGRNYVDRILSLNKYRALATYFHQHEKFVEAYYIENLKEYLQIPDVINAQSISNDCSVDFTEYLTKYNTQEKIKKLIKQCKNKKIIMYGAGQFAQAVFKNYDLSKLNIIAVADKRFEEKRPHKFFDLICIKPEEINNFDFDVVLVVNKDYGKFYNIVKYNILNEEKRQKVEVLPLISTALTDFLPKEKCKNKVCKRPFHIATILPNGDLYTCCPAYLKYLSMGNVLQHSFVDTWNGEKANYLRNSILNDDYSLCDMESCIQLELTDKEKCKAEFLQKNGIVKFPDQIYMGWDYDCNVACITCRNKLIKNDEQTLEKLKLIENSVLEACKTAKLFYTSGNGDPFGSKYARELIKKVAQINPDIKFFIHTNGILCTEKLCDELGIKNRITNVVFSIHASCEETYNKIVHFGNYQKVINNLEWLAKLKKSGQIQTITLAFVVHKLNYQDMPKFVKIAENFDAMASFRHYRQWSNNTEYSYEDMAIFEKTHPDYNKLVNVLKNGIFNSPNCSLDNLLKSIKES